MDAAVPLAFVALVALAWLLAMRRFQLSRWTILVAIAVLVALLLLFFQAEGEDEPESFRGGTTSAGATGVRL
jgi:hydrogenase/urease accessory protein HupE